MTQPIHPPYQVKNPDTCNTNITIKQEKNEAHYSITMCKVFHTSFLHKGLWIVQETTGIKFVWPTVCMLPSYLKVHNGVDLCTKTKQTYTISLVPITTLLDQRTKRCYNVKRSVNTLTSRNLIHIKLI